jgi:hypothetical protein
MERICSLFRKIDPDLGDVYSRDATAFFILSTPFFMTSMEVAKDNLR